MQTFPKDHVILLPHAEEYRDSYTISLPEVVLTLNEPELHEGLSNERSTVEKTGICLRRDSWNTTAVTQ